MNTVRLGDLLPRDAVEKIYELANAGRYRKDDLMPILEPLRAELLAKGVLAEYLAYVLEATIGRMLSGDPRKGYCMSCETHMTMPDSELCQMCQGDLFALLSARGGVN